MKLTGRIVSALLFLVVTIFTSYAVRYEQTPVTMEEQVVTAVDETETVTEGTSRGPGGGREIAAYGRMNVMEYREPCRADNECGGHLLCISGRCDKMDVKGRGHVGQMCSGPTAGPYECISGLCEEGFCAATIQEKADNGYPCSEGAPSVCRSGICRDGQCAASPAYLGLPNMQCETAADCLSGTCFEGRRGVKICGNSMNYAATCAGIGERVALPVECCSGVVNGNSVCSAVPDPDCTQRGQCAGRVGRICGDVGDLAVNPSQCCSGKISGGRCVINVNQRIQPCRLDRACRSGSCDTKTNLCESYGVRDGYPKHLHAPGGSDN